MNHIGCDYAPYCSWKYSKMCWANDFPVYLQQSNLFGWKKHMLNVFSVDKSPDKLFMCSVILAPCSSTLIIFFNTLHIASTFQVTQRHHI